jgi:hypothetical protein
VGWGDGDGAEIDSDGGEGAAGKSAPQSRVPAEKGLLGSVVVGKDGVAQRLEVRWKRSEYKKKEKEGRSRMG